MGDQDLGIEFRKPRVSIATLSVAWKGRSPVYVYTPPQPIGGRQKRPATSAYLCRRARLPFPRFPSWGVGVGNRLFRKAWGAAKVSALLSVVRRLRKKENVTEYFPSLRRSRRCSCRVLVFREVSRSWASRCRALLLQRPPRAMLRCTSIAVEVEERK